MINMRSTKGCYIPLCAFETAMFPNLKKKNNLAVCSFFPSGCCLRVCFWRKTKQLLKLQPTAFPDVEDSDSNDMVWSKNVGWSFWTKPTSCLPKKKELGDFMSARHGERLRLNVNCKVPNFQSQGQKVVPDASKRYTVHSNMILYIHVFNTQTYIRIYMKYTYIIHIYIYIYLTYIIILYYMSN